MKKLAILILIAISLASCSRSFHRWNADRKGDIQEAYKVQDADKRLADLHWFEQTYGQIRAYTVQYESETDQDVKRATRNNLNRWIGEYNAKMRSYDQAMWANEDLPRSLELIK